MPITVNQTSASTPTKTRPLVARRSSVAETTHVKLKELKGALQKYNDEVVPIKKMADGKTWVVSIAPGMELSMNAEQLDKISDPFEDASIKRKSMKKNFKTNKMSGGNRSNVKFAMEAVGSEVRRQIHAIAKERASKNNLWQQQLFTEFDKDGNGTIDKTEFAFFLSGLGVSISKTELELIWGLFDRDGSGGIDYAEFLEIVKPDSQPQYHSPEFIREMGAMSKKERQKRISCASAKLGKLSEVGHARSFANRADDASQQATAGIVLKAGSSVNARLGAPTQDQDQDQALTPTAPTSPANSECLKSPNSKVRTLKKPPA